MEKIKKYIKDFFAIEAETHYKRGFPNLENYNKKLQEMNEFCTEELHNTFGMIPLLKLKDKEFYEDCENDEYPQPRHIFKISEYKNKKYGEIFLVYTSKPNPYEDLFDYFSCFVVTKINDDLKIIKTLGFDDDARMLDYKIWIEYHGLKDITLDSLGEFVRTERFLEPKDCEFSMADYKEDK